MFITKSKKCLNVLHLFTVVADAMSAMNFSLLDDMMMATSSLLQSAGIISDASADGICLIIVINTYHSRVIDLAQRNFSSVTSSLKVKGTRMLYCIV